MKVTKVKVTDLVRTMELFLKRQIEYIDVEIMESQNIIRFTTSQFEDKQELDIA